MSDLYNLMKNAYLADQNFKNQWKDWRTGKVKSKSKTEPENVSLARNKFWETHNALWITKLEPLQDKFFHNSQLAIDEVIDFLEIDIACHRCGYLKEKFLRKLKAILLTNAQKYRIQNAALNLCENPRIRREFADWSRLLAKIADENFLEKLDALCCAENLEVKREAMWMRKKILENRIVHNSNS